MVLRDGEALHVEAPLHLMPEIASVGNDEDAAVIRVYDRKRRSPVGILGERPAALCRHDPDVENGVAVAPAAAFHDLQAHHALRAGAVNLAPDTRVAVFPRAERDTLFADGERDDSGRGVEIALNAGCGPRTIHRG